MKLTSNQMSGALPFLCVQGASMFNSSCPSHLSHFSTYSHLGVKKEWGFLFKSLWFYTVSVNRSMKLQRECWQNWSGGGVRRKQGRWLKKKKRKKLRMHFPKETSGPSPKLKPSLGAFLWQTLPGGTLSSGNIPWRPVQEPNSMLKGGTAES